MNILAFNGAMGSGKSTAIERLIEIHEGRVVNVKFAQPLYDMQEMIYRRIQDVHQRPESFIKDRKLLQWLGTEWGRGINENLWVRLWKKRVEDVHFGMKNALIVCDDVRFDNEAQVIKDLGGKVVHIFCTRTAQRIDVKAGIANHSSEAGIDEKLIDMMVVNDGTVPEFRDNITKIYQSFGFDNVTKQK